MPRRILVVDDDRSVLSMVSDLLEIEGYDVVQATHGFAALQAVEEYLPDCVILDVMMPGLDGHEVLRQIRGNPDRSRLPVVMLTAASEDEHTWQAWTEGVDYFLTKPFDPPELLRFLDYLFQTPLAS